MISKYKVYSEGVGLIQCLLGQRWLGDNQDLVRTPGEQTDQRTQVHVHACKQSPLPAFLMLPFAVLGLEK